MGLRDIKALKSKGFCMAWASQQSVHPIPGKVRRGHDDGSLRVFRHFAWLEVGSVKAALSCPAHQRVTQAVGQIK